MSTAFYDKGWQLNMYEEYIERCRADRRQRGKSNNAQTLLIEWFGEVGEATNAIKHARMWVSEHDRDPSMEEHMLDEMGDVFFYYMSLLKSLGFSLEEVMAYNRNKIEERYGMNNGSKADGCGVEPLDE